MKILYLLSVSLLSIQICECATTSTARAYSITPLPTFPTSIPVPTTNFIVLITSRRTKGAATGVRVMPNIVIASSFVKQKYLEEYEIIEIKEDGGRMVKAIAEFSKPEQNDTNIVVLKTVRWAEPNPNALYHTIPIATRTDQFIYNGCYIYAMTDAARLLRHKAHLIADAQCDKKRICATIVKGIVCIPPEGSALVCNFRLVGIRIDRGKCIQKPYVFSAIAFYDSWIVNQMKPRGYFDYEMVKFNRASSMVKPQKLLSNILSSTLVSYSLRILFS